MIIRLGSDRIFVLGRNERRADNINDEVGGEMSDHRGF
jgi:hypothetical protein